MQIYQIPHSSGKKPQIFISVIDCSGSMGSYWKAVAKNYNEYVPKEGTITITFDTVARLVPDNTLNENINKHGGGGTNITAAFEVMDKEIEKIDKKQMITILFISDGQDNNLGTLEERLKHLKGNQGRTINFMCLGIQSQFPTFLSMYLRELYHNGLPSIPALYLIEYYSDQALYNKFETMKEHFTHKKQLNVKPAVSVFPWVSPMYQVYEGTWILTSEEKLTIDGKNYDIKTGKLEIENILELFRGYVQELQMLSLTKNPNLKDNAGKCLDTMKKIMDFYKTSEGIDLMEWVEDAHLLKVKFYERTKKHKLRHNQFRLKAYVENVEGFTKGEGVKEMSEWEAAKKIGVGTITGTYTQKALSLKGFTLDMYKKTRDEFIELFKSIKLAPGSDQEPSIILKETLKDVFLEEKFIEGLENCESQFDLVETLPVIGLAMKLKRYQKSAEDPWQTEVQAITREGKAVDSVHLFQNKYKFAWTGPENEKMEFVNCLLPLLGPKEEDMIPLLTHPLFKLLMSFIVCQEADALYDEAYLALLANTLLFLLEQPASEWREALWKRTIMTILMIYAKSETFNAYSEKLLKSPDITINAAPDIAKPFVHLVILHHLGKLSKEEAVPIMEYMFIKFFASLVDANRYMENMKVQGETVLDKVKENVVAEFNKYNTLGDLKRAVDSHLAGIGAKIEFCPIVIDVRKMEKLDQKVTMKTMNLMNDHFLKKAPADLDYLFWLHTAIKNRGKKLADIKRDEKEIQSYFFNAFKDELLKSNASNVYSDLKEGFMKKFKEEHMYLMPISVSKLKEYCDEHGIDITKFAYVKELNIIKNACMCPKCPFYLQPQERLMHHLGTWSEKCPKAFHKTVKANLAITPEAILAKVLDGELARDKPDHKVTLEEFNSSKEEAITYIKLLKDEYKKVQEEEAKYTEEIKALESKINQPAGVFHDKKKHSGKGGRGRGRGHGGRGGRGARRGKK